MNIEFFIRSSSPELLSTLKESAEKLDCPVANFLIYRLYCRGLINDISLPNATTHLKKSFDLKYPYSGYFLYNHDDGNLVSFKDAANALEINQNFDLYARFLLGKLTLWQKKSFSRGADLLKSCGQSGLSQGFLELADAYRIKNNETLYQKWLIKAALSGNSTAKYRLAVEKSHGNFKKVNESSACLYWLSVIDQDIVELYGDLEDSPPECVMRHSLENFSSSLIERNFEHGIPEYLQKTFIFSEKFLLKLYGNN
jgi:TPR repeat protein